VETTELVERHFGAIGARVKFTEQRRLRDGFVMNIHRDKKGEFYEIATAAGKDVPEFKILQTVPKDRHLLLLSDDGQRFLCGHDERHWFIAPIADKISTVRGAKQSLLPPNIWEQMQKLPAGEVDKRRNAIFIRQGEWFFVPTTRTFEDSEILRNEPLQRTPRNKPHVCEEMAREGGRLIHVVSGKGMDRLVLSEPEYRERMKDKTFAKGIYTHQTRIADPAVYVRGYVRHSDHATITLQGWHRALINGELTIGQSVAFLD
jgi:hypothetical protein